MSTIDFAMAEDQDEPTLDLTIESLTGTVYDLCVSPYETILGIKTKIQNLEGIPVYQQQLVYGSNELQDEFCLAEYAIPSGAQLKLLIAMRGGPIHAQRMHLDLDDPTLMEIAEFLDSQAGDKYTVMLVRNGDDLDTANLVRVQMHEDSCESLSCSPVHMSESHKRITGASNEEEHTVMRDKVKNLMAKLKKVRSYRQAPPTQMTPSLQRKSTSKVLILDSRASSRILHNSSRGSPLGQVQFNEPACLSSAQRRLMFPPSEDRGCCHCLSSSSRAKSSCKRLLRSVSTKRAHSPEEDSRSLGKKHLPRVKGDDSVFHPPGGATKVLLPHPPPADGRKGTKRVRRTGRVDGTEIATNRSDPLVNLNHQLSQLGLDQTDNNPPSKDQHTTKSSFLPQVSSDTNPPSLTASHAHSKPAATSRKPVQASVCSLPPLTSGPLPSVGGATKVVRKHVSKKNRCMQCSKRVGLASSYNCRCGGMFCAAHRYAESHSCSFDYKEEGRQMLTRNNPVVTAPKLPKI